MSKFIKLTKGDDHVYVNVDNIKVVFRANNGENRISFNCDSREVICDESPDEILALIQADSAGANTTNNDWIEWNGGECPVKPKSRVEHIMRDGGKDIAVAGGLRWSHGGWSGDIMRYKVIES